MTVLRHSKTRRVVAVVAVVASILFVPVIGFAHAVVFPRASVTGAYERYVLRVPNEKNVPTTRVEIRFPANVRVNSFSDVAGWTLQVLTDSAGAITGAVWSGSLPPKRFVEFPFIAVNPKEPTSITWPVVQLYGDTARVEWTGEPGSKAPASVTQVALATETPASFPRSAIWAAWIGLVIAIVSLGLAIRTPSAMRPTDRVA